MIDAYGGARSDTAPGPQKTKTQYEVWAKTINVVGISIPLATHTSTTHTTTPDTNAMKKMRHKPGAFLRIPLSDGTFGYGRALEEPNIAFYNHRTDEPSTDLGTISAQPVLFRVAVRAAGFKNWEHIGTAKLEGEVAKPVVKFTQDIANPQKCVIWDSEGNERAATPEECIGLERSAVWEPHHVEERLLDTFMGRPNESEQHLSVRLE